ncbi:MAG TPA: Rieske 2Fe-2S domain-containing protein [Ktedonobacteraceae bacterium]|nr:Rieske 2Fe-2S domain-containing protein [Ktedonobacteraceae bacterium]
MVERNKVEPSVGSLLGDYRLEQLLEKNEAGQVFLARHSSTGALFRLRVLAVPPGLEPEARIIYLGFFQKQANQVAELQNLHILPLLSYGTYQGIPYLAYQYYPTESLSKRLGQQGPTNAIVAGRYLDQIAEALECSHQSGIQHCNLSTDCIYIKQDGNLVVADFAVLQMLARRDGYMHDAPSSGQEKGAKHELLFGMNESSSPAPEQLLGNPVDARTDVYALGAALYRTLTGHRVFRGKTRHELAQQHLNEPVPPLEVWRHDLPAGLDNAIARAMAKNPQQRFARAGELANAYHQLVAPNDRNRRAFVAASVPALTPVVSEKAKLPEARDRQTGVSRRKALTFIVAGGSAIAAVTVVSIFGIHALQNNSAPTQASVSTTPTGGSTGHSTSTPVTSHGRVLARVSDIPPNSDKQFSLAGSNNPGLLIHLQDNRFVAFNSTCTHAGCAVNYNPQNKLLECPCHGAVFDPSKNAAVVTGPATTPLAPVQISVNADGTITTGS